MNIFISMISDVNSEHLKISQRKEHFKLFSQLGEYFGEGLIPFLPKILVFYQKKFSNIDPQLN